jgi:hypothetical protein
MPELENRSRYCFAFGSQVMTNKTNLSAGGSASLAQTAFAGTIGKLGSFFSTTLQHLYTAHTEKVQMRFAPTPLYSGRICSACRA